MSRMGIGERGARWGSRRFEWAVDDRFVKGRSGEGRQEAFRGSSAHGLAGRFLRRRSRMC